MDSVCFDYCENDITVTPFTCRSSYEFRKDKKWHMVQRFCFWVLSKIGANRIGEETMTVKRHFVEPKDFIERIFKQEECVYRNFNRESTELLIGAGDYADLMGCESMRREFQFNANYHTSNGSRYPDIHNLRVRVIPWMKGMVVL